MAASKAGDGAKRKRASTREAAVKRRCASTDDNEDINAKLLATEEGILQSRKNLNNIADLLDAAEAGSKDSMPTSVALCRIFIRLLAQGSLTFKKTASEKETIVASWLRDQLSRYKQLLLSLLEDAGHASSALTLCMRILKADSQHLYEGKEGSFPTAFHEGIVKAVILSESKDVRQMYAREYAEQFDDLRFYTFKSIRPAIAELVASGHQAAILFERVYVLLSALDGVPHSAEDLSDFFVTRPTKKSHPLRSVSQHKKQGQDAWLTLLGIADTKTHRKRILNVVSNAIAPWFTMPELLSDFLTGCYDAGGSLALLALSGVFYLIRERNLDYPSFYTKLYSLLDRNVLHSKHRSRFFRLLDTFLASSHLPAALVASFIKRLSRLALNAPPSAIAFVIPFIYNLLQRHPQCTFMIHRVPRDSEERQHTEDYGFADPFQFSETDPLETNAIDSCLWEIVQLQSHYHPNIATIAKIISEQFTKQSYNIEDFLDHSYASLMEAEMAKDIKKAPVVEFQIPKRIFFPQEEAARASDSLLTQIWDFGTQ